MLLLLLASFERQHSQSPFISFLGNKELESTNQTVVMKTPEVDSQICV